MLIKAISFSLLSMPTELADGLGLRGAPLNDKKRAKIKELPSN